MNDNDGGLKRSPEPVENASTVEHKKQKISNEQQPEEVSILPTALVLDKVQEETINDLVKNSNAAVSLLQQNTDTTNTSKKRKVETKDSKQTIESEIPSADSIKAVTALQGTENEKSEDISASITSEQLLFALTSIPSSEKEAEGQQGKLTKEGEEPITVDANKNKSTTDNSAAVKVTNVPPVPQTKVPSPPTVPAPALPAPTLSMPTGLGITPKVTPSLPEASVTPAVIMAQSNPVASEPITAPISSASTSASTESETLPTAVTTATSTATTTTTTTTAPILTSALPQTSIANNANSSSIPYTQKSNINNNNTITNTTTAISGPSLSTSAAAAATSLAFSSFPDISAALRRLSNANPSVIEQLSTSASSPRLSSSINAHLNDRKGTSIDVSPSEILGNALAAVAANAAAARSSSNINIASPKQQHQQQHHQQHQQHQQQTTSSSTTTNNNTNNNNAQATATAIGNLAAFTANISSLLNSGGFHRNSFSQEDTQKLAAAVAVARNPQQRRKSSMQVVGNAFSNMIDQAILMGRNKSFSEAANKPVPATSNSNNHLPSTAAAPQPLHVVPKPKLIIKNDQVWKSIEGMEEKSLGFQLYSPQLLLPNLEDYVNGLMEIRVPARFLTFENVKVKKRALWGTDIYTDDSDIVAMAIHSGKYLPHFIEPTIEPTDPFALAVAGKQKESIEATKRLALSGKKYTQHDQHLIPDHDLKVTVRVLPTLQHYASSIRHKLKSREWGKHDGMSLFVNKVEKVKRGDARLKGRSSLKSNMFAYELYRKQALGLHQDKKPSSTTKIISSPPIQKGRIKKTRRVMRMFQIRSELKNKNNK